MSQFNSKLLDQIEKTDQWIAEKPEERSNLPALGISYGFKLVSFVGSQTSKIGEQKFTRRFALLDLKKDQKPDFAFGFQQYIQDIVDEFQDQLTDAIYQLSIGDTWPSPADATAATSEDSVVAAATQAADSVESEVEAQVGSKG